VQLLDGGQYPLHAMQRGDAPINFNALLPPISTYPAVAKSGLMRYTGDNFPAAMRDNLFSAEHNTRKIVRHVLTPKEASYAVQDIDFVTTEDPNVHFSDVLEDADGSLLVIDTGSWYVHHCPTGRILHSPARGGIYRVRCEASDRQNQKKGSAEIANASPAASSAKLRQVLHSTNTVEVAFAARALGRQADKTAAAELISLLGSTNLQLRLAAAEALSSCGDMSSVLALTGALAEQTDDFLTHAITFALHRVADRESLEQGLHHPSSKVQRAALLLLAQPPFDLATAEVVTERLFAPYEPLRETARWVLEQHQEWGAAGAAFIGQLLRIAEPTDADRAALERALPQFQSNQTVINAVTESLNLRQTEVSDDQRRRLLEALAAAELKSTPEPWAAGISDLLASDHPGLLKQAILAAGALKISGIEPALHAIARENARPAELRVAALRELVRREPRLSDSDFAFLNGQINRSSPSNLRLAAAETLLAANLSNLQLVPFLKSIRSENLISPLAVLSVVERQGVDSAAFELLEYLSDSLEAGWTLPAGRIVAIQNALPAEQKAAVQNLLDQLSERAAQQTQKLAEYEPLLAGGNRERGQILFYNKAVCSTCHSIWGTGGKVGPDLTKVGSIRAGRDILESIVLPSATIAQGYDLLNVRLRDGEVASGIRVGKGEDPLILRDAAGNEMRYRQQTIEAIVPSKVSLMPEGLLQPLTHDEIRDLLAFLQSLK
jgi:putative heme-binding domain-containing protein